MSFGASVDQSHEGPAPFLQDRAPHPGAGMTSTLYSSVNGTGVDGVVSAYLVVSSAVMATCVCGIAGNCLVVWLLSIRLQKSPFCVYILNLALADLLFLLCMASLLCLETGSLVGASPSTKAYEVLQRTKYFAYTAGLSLLSAISTHRCISVLFPLWYKCHRPRHLSATVCAVLWALAFVMNTLATIFCSRFWRPDKTRCFQVDMVLSGLILGVFTPIMALSSATLFVCVRRSSLLRRQRPTRLYLVILASVFVFLTCSLPLGLYWFLLYWLRLPRDVSLLYICMSRLFSSISSSANPAIYFLVGRQRGRRVQESLGAVLGRALQEEPELEGRETPSVGTSEST